MTVIKLTLLIGVIVFQYKYGYAKGFTDTLLNEIGMGVLCGAIITPTITNEELRSENIFDIEVLQIQAVIKSIHPGAIVNIGGVTEGCPCDEKDSCTNQVPIVAYLTSGSVGITLSKIDNDWMVGVVQRWWLEYEKVFRFNKDAKIGLTHSSSSSISFESKVQALHDSMPTCAGNVRQGLGACSDEFLKK